MRNILKKYSFITLGILLFGLTIQVVSFLTPHVYAEEGYVLLAEIPTVDTGGGINLPIYMKGLVVAIVGLAIVLAVMMIVIGGIQYVLAAVPSSKEGGKRRIAGAIGGLLLVLLSYIVIQAINPTLLLVGLNLGQTIFNNADNGGTNIWGNDIGGGNSSGGNGSGGSGSGGNTLPCSDPAEAKARINAGGTVCNREGSCKTCNTAPYEAFITASAAKYNVDPIAIRAVIARESSCDPNPGSVDGLSCGLMQPKFSSAGGCSTDPATNIDQGTKILAAAYQSARQLVGEYGDRVTLDELAYAIYNAGVGQSTASADCNPGTGWYLIPKWGCPINPGSAQYNACFIRSNACGFGACF